MKKLRLRLVSAGILAAVAALAPGLRGATAAELTLMVEPSYPPDQAAEVYKPLVDYLATTTQHQIKLVTPRNYHFFWRDLRQNTAVDLVFAEAHFTDFRIKRFNAEPLVRTAEKTSYTLLASDQLENPTLATLFGRSIVTMPSPSLGFALLIELFPNPMSQPNILSTAASWRDGVEIVFGGEGDAAIVPTWLKEQYPNLVPIQTSREFPGAAITASAGLDGSIRSDITAALLTLHENADMYSVLAEIGVTRFEPATAAEYEGAEKMLKEFYGYD